MKRIFAYFSQNGGANAIMPLLDGLRPRFDITISGATKVRDNFNNINFNLCNLGDLTSLDFSKKRDLLIKLAPQIVITDTINLARSMEGGNVPILWDIAGELKVPSLAYVDSWWAYKNRFCLPGIREKNIYPDRIAVVDEIMRDSLLALGFPEDRITITGSPRFEYLSRRLTNIDDNAKVDIRNNFGLKRDDLLIVFVSQPLEELAGFAKEWGFTEKTTLTILCNAVNSLACDIRSRLVFAVMPHPEEDENDLKDLVDNIRPDFRIIFPSKDSALDMLSVADLAVGMFSILLVEAVIMKRPVLSIQLGFKKDDMLITNITGATIAIRKKEEINSVFLRAIVDADFRTYLLERAEKFEFIKDSFSRWGSLINGLVAG